MFNINQHRLQLKISTEKFILVAENNLRQGEEVHSRLVQFNFCNGFSSFITFERLVAHT